MSIPELGSGLGILDILSSREEILADIMYKSSCSEKISYNIPIDIAIVRATKLHIQKLDGEAESQQCKEAKE